MQERTVKHSDLLQEQEHREPLLSTAATVDLRMGSDMWSWSWALDSSAKVIRRNIHSWSGKWTDSCQWAALTEPFGINWFVHLSAWVKTTLLCSLPTALLLLPHQTVGDCPTPAWWRPTEPTVHWSRKLRCLSYSEHHSVAAPCRRQGPDWVTQHPMEICSLGLYLPVSRFGWNSPFWFRYKLPNPLSVSALTICRPKNPPQPFKQSIKTS